ncbi:hypothetical protein [Streptomyces cavernicola]|uniref:Translation initiation factor IF-2 n=1 Tax=Streptomyces cavernicola TaxID=3043613 RepID=A0ABT6SM62_9ACTN|nr:hypothetical protein [Streptomyces sp. B-S-A6]MDI3409184.1 hypothetical protein [Streptomyces sp. B-S-A6]
MTPARRRGRRNRPVFIERAGRRRRVLRQLAAVLGCACAGYLMFLVVLVDAVRQPAGTAPPRMDVPLHTTNARHDTTVPDDEQSRPNEPSTPTPTTTAPTTAPTTVPAPPRDGR